MTMVVFVLRESWPGWMQRKKDSSEIVGTWIDVGKVCPRGVLIATDMCGTY